MLKRMCLWVVLCLAAAGSATAQEVVFVQIEAKRNLQQATEAAREYAADLPDVNGFSLGGGWYGIALGPYTRTDANRVLQVYRAEGVIPSDAFLALPSVLGRQFWPVGANVLGRGVVNPPVTSEPEVVAEPSEPADETPREAQASERRLTPTEKQQLQVMLQWAGTYTGAIDGAFGRGTRNAMAQWQTQNGFEQTGILTTLQRAELLRQYNSVLDGLGMVDVVNGEAGISVVMPTGAVKPGRTETPFASYDATGAVPEARVILISQEGDQTTLFGLYDIMQTLQIVPLDGPRERGQRRFTIEGANERIVSYTEVSLEQGQIKGFTLVWPAGDEERRSRVLAQMKDSFARLPGVLPAVGASDAGQSIDLVSGLEIRKPRVSRSGFFVDPLGTVVTTLEAVESCGRITLEGEEIEADILASDGDAGIAILRPSAALSPLAIARFSAATPRLQSEIAVAGYSFEGVLGAPSMTFGTLSDLRGLGGEPDLKRLAMNVLPGDAGGPVLDAGGGVLGMLLPKRGGARSLPEEVNFAADADAIQRLLEEAGLSGAQTDSSRAIDPIDLTSAAQNMTVLVSCWD